MKIGKKLKKNNVAVDVVNFGAADVNGERLEAFVEAVNSGDNSHLVSVPTGTILSDTLFGSPIYQQARHHAHRSEKSTETHVHVAEASSTAS